jgi:tripartite-type tricarboxylate transporter receptor subunit TctC
VTAWTRADVRVHAFLPAMRRKLIAALCGGLVCASAHAQSYPVRQLRFVVPFAAGGTIDILGRLVAPAMSKALGQQIVVENRPGGGTVIATELVARAPADAHTILLMGPSYTINLFARKLPYDTERDFAAIARLAANPLLLSVHPSLPTRNIKELVALARAKPGELTYATASPTGFQRLAVERFKILARIDIVNVPYQGGGPATIAVMGGHTTINAGNVSEAAPYVEAGRLRAIAVTSLTRSDVMKDVPTLHESGYPNFEATNWFGAVTRANAPAASVERLSTEFARALDSVDVKAGMGKIGLFNYYLPPDRYEAFLRGEFRTNEKVVKATGMRME